MKFLSDLNISANYQRMVDMKKEAKQTIRKQMKNENSSFVPSKLESNKPIYFAICNASLVVYTSDGKNQQHVTGTVV